MSLINPINFRHPLMDDLPTALKNDTFVDILHLTLWGDSSAKHRLIQHLLLVAKRCVGMILAVYPSSHNELDDMVSEAALVVVNIIERVCNGSLQVDPLKLSNYMAVSVLQQVNEMLAENESAIRVPYSTQKAHNRTGRDKPVHYQPQENFDQLPAAYGGSDFEVREALDLVISAPVERRIIELREAAYTDSEIGELLGLSRQTVTLLRFNLHQQYLEVTQ